MKVFAGLLLALQFWEDSISGGCVKQDLLCGGNMSSFIFCNLSHRFTPLCVIEITNFCLYVVLEEDIS